MMEPKKNAAAYPVKLALHIPHFAWDDGLVPVDYERFRRDLAARLGEIGADSYYVIKATGCYKGREYEEEILTVSCGGSEAEDITAAFERCFRENNHMMRQESFAYERNGILHVINLEQ